MATQKKPTKTRKAPTIRVQKNETYETDSTYFLKLVVFVLLGMFWLRFAHPISWFGHVMTGIPLGLLVGLLLVNKFERNQEDRKIWYAILVVVTIISYFYPSGINL